MLTPIVNYPRETTPAFSDDRPMDTPKPHYTVLARRFRPQTFDEVIGQQHVAQALKNALISDRVAHAYLFTGARGVGKTSMARILAKALNCPHTQDGVPCNACEICAGISTGNDVDVMEIDGASNRRIDDIRDIRANISVKAMRTRFKVYIIDEVHMLTKEAFNALLKTLEEPPPNVKFVFCTTEPNKVPDTILSRCQRFDFSSINTQNIVTRLQEIAAAEGFDVEPDALELIARRAGGSMRDSQSLFDQLLAFGGERITARDVHSLLGTADDERLLGIIGALAERDRTEALRQLDAALSEGVQLSEFMDQLISCFRDLMVLCTKAENVPLLSLAEARRTELSRQTENWGLETVVTALQILVDAKGRMFRVSFARTLVELALVRITLLEDLDQLASLIRGLTAGDGAAPRPQTPSSTGGPRQPSTPPKADAPPANTPPRNRSEMGGRSASEPASRPGENSTGTELDTLAGREHSNTERGPKITLSAGSEEKILSQLLSKSDDATRANLKAATLAISGPNQLDLVFSSRYHFPKQYCDRPDIRARLEAILAKITGRPVKLTVQIDDSAPPPEKEPGPEHSAAGQSGGVDLKQAERDPFVQEAVSIFNGKVQQIDAISAGEENSE